MSNSDYKRGMLREINMSITNLIQRKKKILAEDYAVDLVDGEETEKKDEFTISKSSYSRYLDMMKDKRDPVDNPRVVYQGEPGAYSEMACRNFFGKSVNAKGLYQFEDTFIALKNGDADYAVLPIENSSTGAIRQVYDLLEQYHFFFVGETTVKVQHALMVLPEAEMEDIKTVYSHEQGLFQCERFLNSHPEWNTAAQADTAGSAKMVAELKDKSKAAICSKLAAEIYGLKILKEAVNNNNSNTTRFIVISPKPEMRDHRDKVCISLTTDHSSGALHNVLTVFAVRGINLVRLESRPIPEHNWEYMFFIEFTGDLNSDEIDEVIHEISIMTADLRVLGNFRANL